MTLYIVSLASHEAKLSCDPPRDGVAGCRIPIEMESLWKRIVRLVPTTCCCYCLRAVFNLGSSLVDRCDMAKRAVNSCKT